MRSYVGIDLHRRRSVVVCLDEGGERLWWRRIDNSPGALAELIALAGPEPEVALEATFGWYWAADLIAEAGGRLHLAHPLGIKGFENRRVKNDLRDATLLADLLRMGRLPEPWIPPGSVRELRELVRYRHKLSQLRAGLKSQIHGVLGKEGVIPPLGDLWGPGGFAFLNQVELADAYSIRVESLRDLIEVYDREVEELDYRIHQRLRGDPGYRAILALTGVGRVFGGVSSTRDGEDLQIVMLEHDEQGRIITAGSGFRDSPWPERLLDGPQRRIGNLVCPIVNPHVQLALKLTYTEVFPDRPLRPKDLADIELLRAALGEVPFT